ncbi:hypothetical protein, partial [Nonomuraea sp. NPDC048901]|uniref:hypothetical protein n=1 Tax=Nonomuraea sp. NPDC048901 TaxID=3155627 RepID=UPI0033C31FB1
MPAAYRSHTIADSGTTPYTIAKPSGVVSGDVLVLCQYADFGALTDMVTPSGWTQIGSVDAASSSDLHGKVWVRTAGGSEPSTYSLSHHSSAFSVGILVAVSGGSAPSTTANSTSGTGTAIATPGITPTGSTDLEVRFAGCNGAGTVRTLTVAAGFTEPASADVNHGGYPTATVGYRTLVSGSATSAANFTASGTISATARIGFTLTVPSDGTSATATPSVVSATASIPSATTIAGSTATPAVVAAVASVPAPATSVGGIEFVAASHAESLTGVLPAGAQQGDILL